MNFIGHLDWAVATTEASARCLPANARDHGPAATFLRCTIAAIAAVLAAAPAAGADTVYRCADNVYQSEPCPGGQALDIDPQRNVVAPERRRPAPVPAAEARERPEVIVMEREAPPAPPVVVREPLYVWPHRAPPRVHAPVPYPHQRHPQAHRQPQVERPGSRAPRDVGRPAYGFKP
ncbi:MAG TPA: hypothetical protein PK177_02735 [Burkholderiaceae bacterium]|nr:hypothetical protein [Burkholderiaceae bacterium]